MTTNYFLVDHVSFSCFEQSHTRRYWSCTVSLRPSSQVRQNPASLKKSSQASARPTRARRHRRSEAGTVVAYRVRGACVAAIQPVHFRFGSLADIEPSSSDVRITRKSGHPGASAACPLCANRRPRCSIEIQSEYARDTWATRIELKALTLECVTVTSVGYSPHQYSAPPHTSAPGLSEQCCASQQCSTLVRFTPESGHSWA